MPIIEANGSKRPSFEMNVDTRVVCDRLKQVPIGETINYVDLSELLGAPVSGGSAVIQSALRSLEHEGLIFGNIRSVGYQRLNDIAIVQSTEQDRLALRRKARRTVEKLSHVADFEALPNALKIKHNAAVSGFGAIAAILAPAKMKALETSVEKAQVKLPLAKTLAAFTE